MQDKSRVMFVHVPRTAGTSINDFLRQKYPREHSPRRNPSYANHDPYYSLVLTNNPSEFFKFAVVRNPYQRTYSHYKAFLLKLKCNSLPTLSETFTFNDFLKYKRTLGVALFSPITLNRNNFSLFDQSFFLLDDCGEIKLDKVYRFENLKEFEDDFNTKISHRNKSTYIDDEYVQTYNKENIGLVKSLYLRDFSLLDYSTHFDDSLN